MKNKKKILYIINHKSFFVSHRLKIALEAKKQNFEPFLICGTDASDTMKKNAKKILKKTKIKYKEIASEPNKFNLKEDIQSIYKIYQFIKKFNPNLIHIASPKALILGGIAARFYNKSAIIMSVSGFGHLFTEKSYKNKFLSHLFIKILKFILSLSKSVIIVQNKDDYYFLIKSLKIKKNKIKIVKGSGVNINKFTPNNTVRQKSIIFPGRLLLNKGILEFYEASKIINNTHKNWHFIIAGSSDYKSPVLIKKNKLDEILKKTFIKYIGHVDHLKMPNLYSKSSIICLPSYREGMPMALQEAAASGLPVVTTNVTGCKEAVINNKTGFLVKSKDVKTLVEKLLVLIENNNLRKKFGNESRKFAVKNFDENLIIKKHIKIYKDLIRHD